MTQNDITKFQEIHLEKYWIEISSVDASKQLSALLNLVKSTLSFKNKLDA